jgi:hypothetical protein
MGTVIGMVHVHRHCMMGDADVGRRHAALERVARKRDLPRPAALVHVGPVAK